jgi:hypothetical protein
MKLKEPLTKVVYRMTAVVFVFFGAVLVCFGALFERAGMPLPGTVCLHLGIVTVAVVLLDLVWRLCGGQIVEHEVESGLEIGRSIRCP